MMPPTIDFSPIFSNPRLIQLCKAEGGRGYDGYTMPIVTDTNVSAYYSERLLTYLRAHGLKTYLIVVPAGEASKSREMKVFIEEALFKQGCGRDTLIIALGGGVVTDLAGFVAATYCRGVPVVYMPTSLLAMVDAAIGGKTGINTEYGKNTLGTFTQPQAIFIDPSLLVTLPLSHYIDAFSEIIKHALIYDETYLALIESNLPAIQVREVCLLRRIIKRSCEIKSAIVATDEKEWGQREILNFGHTIGHALETASNYQLTHGRAVAIGLIAESYLCYRLGLLTQAAFDRIQALVVAINSLREPVAAAMPATKTAILQALFRDKKCRQGYCRWVLLAGIGQVSATQGSYAHVVEEAIVEEAIDYSLTFTSFA